MLTCILIAVTVATATETTVYYVYTDESSIQHRDIISDVAILAYRDKDDVLVVPGLPGLPQRIHPTRCGFESLYATLTGERT